MMTSSGSTGVEVVVALALVAVLAGVVVLAGGVPMQCQAPIARPPFRGCRNRVYGFLGRCRNHGFQPGRRRMAAVGGSQLLQRRVCRSCGQPTVFCRMRADGKPYLGCSGYPACKNIRWLDS
jgi:ribosomal protein L34